MRPPSGAVEMSDISINSPGASLIADRGRSSDRCPFRRSSVVGDITKSEPVPQRHDRRIKAGRGQFVQAGHEEILAYGTDNRPGPAHCG